MAGCRHRLHGRDRDKRIGTTAWLAVLEPMISSEANQPNVVALTANDFVANFDRQPAGQRQNAGVVPRADRVWPILQALDEIRRRLAERARGVGLAVAALGREQARAVVAHHDDWQSLAINDRYRDLVSHAPALGDRCIGDGLRQFQRYVLLSDDALCAGWR